MGNLFANLENSLGEDVEEKRPKKLLKEGPMSAGSGYGEPCVLAFHPASVLRLV